MFPGCSFRRENYHYAYLNDEECPYIAHSPEALYCSRSIWANNLNVLFIKYIQGDTLTEEAFYAKLEEEQGLIKAAILEAYTYLRTRHHIIHNDARWENLIWRKDTGKLTIIDLECMTEQAGELLPFDYELNDILFPVYKRVRWFIKRRLYNPITGVQDRILKCWFASGFSWQVSLGFNLFFRYPFQLIALSQQYILIIFGHRHSLLFLLFIQDGKVLSKHHKIVPPVL